MAANLQGKRPCNCYASTNIADEVNYGTGDLDFNGFWEFPCNHPESLAYDAAREREAFQSAVSAAAPAAG